MHIVIARISHETNSFSPLPTPLAAFDPHWGEDARRHAQGARTAIGAFLAFADAVGATAVTPVCATANPSGRVDDAAFERMAESVVAAVRAGCDAVLLDLHGAMATHRFDDAEGELLERLRAVAPEVPIGVALDLHANLTPSMVANADVIVGFKTYPHVDMYETGEHVARVVQGMLGGRLRPALAASHPPMIAHTLKMNTAAPGAMRDIIAAARAAEKQPGVLAVSVFGGFALSDVAYGGMAIAVVAENPVFARRFAHELGTQLWSRRADFVYRAAPLAESIASAREIRSRRHVAAPVLLLDHGDNCMSGGPCDNMDVIVEALRQGLDGVVAGPICDPAAVATLTAAGVGARVTVEVGNRLPLPQFAADKKPVTFSGSVAHVGSGEYTISGPTYTGMRCSMGRVAVLDTGRARLLVTERPHEPWDRGVFSSVGIDPAACDYLILKSRMYCRPVFEPLSVAMIECAGQGVTSSDYGLFDFRRLDRNHYPLQPERGWTGY